MTFHGGATTVFRVILTVISSLVFTTAMIILMFNSSLTSNYITKVLMTDGIICTDYDDGSEDFYEALHDSEFFEGLIQNYLSYTLHEKGAKPYTKEDLRELIQKFCEEDYDLDLSSKEMDELIDASVDEIYKVYGSNAIEQSEDFITLQHSLHDLSYRVIVYTTCALVFYLLCFIFFDRRILTLRLLGVSVTAANMYTLFILSSFNMLFREDIRELQSTNYIRIDKFIDRFFFDGYIICGILLVVGISIIVLSVIISLVLRHRNNSLSDEFDISLEE